MFETLYPLGDFEVYAPIVDVGGEIILVYEFLWYVRDSDADIFGSIQGRAEIKVGDVVAGHTRAWGR